MILQNQLAVGQRWLYSNGYVKVLIELTDADKIKGVVVQSYDDTYHIGDVRFGWTICISENWTLLDGQEAPVK